MAYGGETIYEPYSIRQKITRQVEGENPQTLSDHTSIGQYIAYRWNRSGRNAHAAVIGERPAYVLRTKMVRVFPNNPKLYYYQYNARLGRYVKKRKYLWVPRYYRVRVPSPGLGLYNQPNPETYLSQAGYLENGSAVGKKILYESIDGETKAVTYTKELSGAFCFPFYPFGSNVLMGSVSVSAMDGAPLSSYILSEASYVGNGAVSSMYQAAKQQSSNLGEIFATRRLTIKSMFDIVYRASLAFILLKRGELRAAARVLFPNDPGQFAKDYLLWQYGIAPLLKDVNGIARELAQLSLGYSGGKAVGYRNGQPSKFLLHNVYRSTVPGEQIQYSSGTYGYKAQTDYTIMTDLEFGVRTGLFNPAALAWELLPYSFVVDWFLPIGNYLNSLDAFAFLRVRSYHTSIIGSETLTLSRFVGGRDADGYEWSGNPATYTVYKSYFQRTVANSPPNIPMPEWKDPTSILHWAEFSALLLELVYRKK